MKRLFIAIAATAMTAIADAQVLRQNFMDGVKPGDTLEKNVYTEARASQVFEGTWNGAFSKKENNMPSPKAAEGLSYPGYKEGGASIAFGYEPGLKGNRASTYTLTQNGKGVGGKGIMYVSCLVRVNGKIGVKTPKQIINLATYPTGAGGRAGITITRSATEQGKINMGCDLQKVRVLSQKGISMKETNLIVLKLDYNKGEVSLFINPDTKGAEPAADCVAKAGDDPNGKSSLKGAIKALSIINSNSFSNILVGNFRISADWTSICN